MTTEPLASFETVSANDPRAQAALTLTHGMAHVIDGADSQDIWNAIVMLVCGFMATHLTEEGRSLALQHLLQALAFHDVRPPSTN